MAQGTDLALDLNPLSSTYRDVYLVNGDFPMVLGIDQIQQNLLQTLGIFRAEWFLDNTIGLDYYGTVFIKNPSQAAINAMFVSAILGVAGVTSILSFSTVINAAARSMTVAFRVSTTAGTISYSGTLPNE
jgi:hypothetical protein